MEYWDKRIHQLLLAADCSYLHVTVKDWNPKDFYDRNIPGHNRYENTEEPADLISHANL